MSECEEITGIYHTLIIRNVPDQLYWKLKALKFRKNCRSWVELLELVVKEHEEELKWV
jgi:hypothetical protein